MNVRVDGVEIGYEVHGKGVPVLCVHGFPLNGKMWAPIVAPLAKACRLIVPDLRGFGRSGVSETATMARYADDLKAVVTAAGEKEPVVVMGLSMGGYIAFEFWRRHRGMVRGLVLADTRAGADSEEGKKGRREMMEKVRERGSVAAAEGMVKKLFAAGAAQRLKDEWLGIMSSAAAKGVIAALGAMAERPDSTPTLKTIDVPTLVVVGEEDAITPAKEAQLMHEGVKGSRLAVIAGAGHMSPVEKPVEFARVVGGFVGEV